MVVVVAPIAFAVNEHRVRSTHVSQCPRRQKVRADDITQMLFFLAPPHPRLAASVIEESVRRASGQAERVIGVHGLGFVAEDGAEGGGAVGAAY